MKKGTQLNINGQSFICKGSIKDSQITRGKELYNCYDRPSATKAYIFNAWRDWASELNGWLDVDSYNCMMFTLKGEIDIENVRYYVYITKTRQEIYNIEED